MWGYRYVTKDIVHFLGSVSGIDSTSGDISITLPFACIKQNVFLCPGNALYYTKAYINANTNTLIIMPGTGTSSTSYVINVFVDVH